MVLLEPMGFRLTIGSVQGWMASNIHPCMFHVKRGREML